MTKVATNLHMTLVALIMFPLGMWAQFEYQQGSQVIRPAGEAAPSSVAQRYAPVVIPAEMPYPGGEKEREKQKRGAQKPRPGKYSPAPLGNAPGPQVLDTLRGNAYGGSVPNDDAFAINRQGQAVSMRNSSIGAYQVSNDSVLFQETLFNFYRPRAVLPGSKYDPRVLYDPEADRFIVVYLSGTTYQSSRIILGFSKTAHPADGFNIYVLNGNPINDSTWSDYPHISLNHNDLFITVNTFYNGSVNNSGYVQSTIRQLDKQAGYDSLPITEHYYANLRYNGDPLFNFTGLSGGRSLKEPPAYFLGNENLSAQNDTFYLAKISDSATGNPQMSLQVYRSENTYGLPPAARQPNDHTLDCNDARIQGGFQEDGLLHFVGNTITPDSSAGFYHGIIDFKNSPQQPFYFKVLSFDPIDAGYPKITYTGKNASEIESILTFNHSSDSLNPGFSSIFFDNDTTYSSLDTLVQGGDYIDIIADGNNRKYERWGDYTGAQPAYGDTGVIWAAGYQASPQGRPLTAILKLRSPNYNQTPVGIQLKEHRPAPTAVDLAPNPARNTFALHFEQAEEGLVRFAVFRIDGAREQVFAHTDRAYPGPNTFHFRTEHLSPGSYLVVMRSENGALRARKKLVVR
ncbi:MAG: hypothetical protein RI842_08275 [Schleiferiaceae bacterium]|nr:hypothetical protein [Schleiferiaceae bacterium]MDR9442703.1 hypothetical protein [Schleiferiaceae bacterium]